MTLEQDLVTKMLASSAISAIVGTRISPEPLPQGDVEAGPTLTYQRVSTVPYYSQAGRNPLSLVRLQINCWAQTTSGYGDAFNLSSAVVSFLDTYRSPGVPAEQAGATFVLNKLVQVDNETQPPTYRFLVDVKIYTNE